MSDIYSTFWNRGRLIDHFVRARRPWLFVAAVAAVILCADALVSIVIHALPPVVDREINSRSELKNLIQTAKRDEKPWLLIGDSVLAGNVLAARLGGGGGAGSHHGERVIDAMRGAINKSLPDTFHQAAFDGLLPVDLERIVRQLNRQDPEGRIGAVIEINPRFFSRVYGPAESCTREWFETLAPRIVDDAGVRWMEWAKFVAREGMDQAAHWMPLYRHLGRLTLRPDLNADWGLLRRTETGPPAAADPLSGKARMIEHYRDPDLTEASAQVRAFERTLAELAATDRRVFLFETPLNDTFMREATTEGEYGGTLARLDAMVAAGRPSNLSYIQLDHPLFTPDHFIDHCHLLPGGNRLLATNLLCEMNLGLDVTPRPQELARPESVNESFVFATEGGSAEGTGWQARFDRPGGVAVTQDGRIIVADTGNNCLKVLEGPRQIVRIIAGRPGEPGNVDGPGGVALLESPGALCAVGDDVWFADHNGGSLRRLRDGVVETAFRLEGPAWNCITAIRSQGGPLYLLDGLVAANGGTRVLEFDPKLRRTRLIMDSAPGMGIRAFDVSADGRIAAADQANRIWLGTLDCGVPDAGCSMRIDELPQNLSLFFDNRGTDRLELGSPATFTNTHFEFIRDVRFVDHYNGLLVADEHPLDLYNSYRTVEDSPTERVHLRLLHIPGRMAYLWTKTAVYDRAVLPNVHFNMRVTSFHEGFMDLDRRTHSLYWLEKKRSRLYRIEDGLWALAKSGNGESMRIPSTDGAVRTMALMRPDRHLDRRDERLPRRGPYFGMMVGSSMMDSSEMITDRYYSLCRLIELRLRDMLGIRDGIRIDLVQRYLSAASMQDCVKGFETYVHEGTKVDFVMIETYPMSFRPWENMLKEEEPLSTEKIDEYLARVRAAAAVYDTKVIFFDNSHLWGNQREGLRPATPNVVRFLERAKAQGMRVIEPATMLMQDYLETFPWGSTRYTEHHGSPMALDATADRVSALLYPLLASYFRDRTPSRLREPVSAGPPPDPAKLLIRAIEGANLEVLKPQLFDLESRAMHQTFDGVTLDVFVDLMRVPNPPQAGDEPGLDRLGLSVILKLIGPDSPYAAAAAVNLKLAIFQNYDEYGEGVRSGASLLGDMKLDRAGLEALIKSVSSEPQP